MFYTYAVGKLTNGFLADHANMKKFLAAGFLLSALCNFAMGFSTAVWVSTLVWGLNGWFQSLGAPGGVVAMTAWYSNRERGRCYGIWSTAHSIGEGLTFIGVGTIVACSAGVGILGAGAGGHRHRRDGVHVVAGSAAHARNADSRRLAQRSLRDAPRQDSSVFRTQLSILKIPAIWVLALSSATIYVTRYASFLGCLVSAGSARYSLQLAGTLLMIATVAGIVGAVAYGSSPTSCSMRGDSRSTAVRDLEIAGLLLFSSARRTLPPLILAWFCSASGERFGDALGGLVAVDIAQKCRGCGDGTYRIFS